MSRKKKGDFGIMCQQVRFEIMNGDVGEIGEVLGGIAVYDGDTLINVICGCCGGVFEPEDVKILEEPTGINLAKLAASYSDGIIFASGNIDPELEKFCRESGLPVLEYNAEAVSDGSYIDDYNSFYDNL